LDPWIGRSRGRWSCRESGARPAEPSLDYRLAREGKLNDAQRTYAAPTRAIEELYDTETDPFLLRNLAGSPERREVMVRMRQRLAAWVVQTRDLGFVPESDLRSRIEGTTPYDLAAVGCVPVGRIFETADLVGRDGVVARQTARLKDEDASRARGARPGGSQREGARHVPRLCARPRRRGPADDS
jgi:hypothetical protein